MAIDEGGEDKIKNIKLGKIIKKKLSHLTS